MNTLLLSPPDPTSENSGWDLVLDANNTLAIATGPYAIAQDVACEVKTFLGECWYNTAKGVPYLENILGKRPSLQYMKAKFIAAGLLTPNVVSIVCYLTGPAKKTRQVGGQLQITDDGGVQTIVQTPTVAGIAPWYVSAVIPQ